MNGDFLNALQNAYPTVHERIDDVQVPFDQLMYPGAIDSREVFDYIRDIKDPEHPLTLEQLGVVDFDSVKVDDEISLCRVEFTPTIPHCSMATLIGLTIKVHLLRVLPPRFKIDVKISPGSHAQETAINKQLSDKERIAAALENKYLLEVINDCLMFPEEQEVPSYVEKLVDVQSVSKNAKWRYVLRSRQPVTSYRRWKNIMDDAVKGLSIFCGV